MRSPRSDCLVQWPSGIVIQGIRLRSEARPSSCRIARIVHMSLIRAVRPITSTSRHLSKDISPEKPCACPHRAAHALRILVKQGKGPYRQKLIITGWKNWGLVSSARVEWRKWMPRSLHVMSRLFTCKDNKESLTEQAPPLEVLFRRPRFAC